MELVQSFDLTYKAIHREIVRRAKSTHNRHRAASDVFHDLRVNDWPSSHQGETEANGRRRGDIPVGNTVEAEIASIYKAWAARVTDLVL